MHQNGLNNLQLKLLEYNQNSLSGTRTKLNNTMPPLKKKITHLDYIILYRRLQLHSILLLHTATTYGGKNNMLSSSFKKLKYDTKILILTNLVKIPQIPSSILLQVCHRSYQFCSPSPLFPAKANLAFNFFFSICNIAAPKFNR